MFSALGVLIIIMSSFVKLKYFQDEDYRRRRAAAALPPMMMSAEMRSGPFYVDLNGVIDDALADHNKHIEHFLETWTDDEKQVKFILKPWLE